MNMDSMDCDNKYQHGKIYKLTSSETTDIYIGSTKQPLCKRLREHKDDYTSFLKGRFHYVSSFDLIKYVDCKIELIKEYPCNSKKELEREEGYYQRKMKCVNMRIAGRTDKEWRDDNKEEIRERKKKYRENNKEKIKAHKSKKCICECGREYAHDHKARHERTKIHQDYINGIIKAHKYQKCICECGMQYTHNHKARHEKSKIHQDYIKENNN
jgi:Tat protein secretion system quality control protein TatD with DNase activity